MHSVTGFVGHNEQISIKRSKCVASFVINRNPFFFFRTVIQFVNLQQGFSSTHRHNFQATLFCLFLPYVIKPDAYDMLTCHPKHTHIHTHKHTHTHTHTHTHVYIYNDILIAYVRFAALFSFSTCSDTLITAAGLHRQRQLFSSNL